MSETTEEKRSIGELLKHPLASVVIGFPLTGVLGTTLTQSLISLSLFWRSRAGKRSPATNGSPVTDAQ